MSFPPKDEQNRRPLSSPRTRTPTSTHERDIPSLGARFPTAQVIDVHTTLSYCLPTSLAFFKRLIWEQTPWIPHLTATTSVNPISKRDATTISTYLRDHNDLNIRKEAIHNAVLFGSAYPLPNPSAPLGTYPQLFVVFPGATKHLTSNEKFLGIWHDQIVKPAFDRAWKDSGIAPTYGADLDGLTRILPASGVRTANDALPWSGFLAQLGNGSSREVRAYWPSWKDNWGRGREGQYSDVRAKILHEAWTAMLGMIEGHPDLPDCQNLVLLAVSRDAVHFGAHRNAQDIYKDIGVEWDKLVDARYMVPGSFHVVLETVIATEKEEEVEEEQMPWVGNAQGQFKRMVEEEEGGDEDRDAHRTKRRKGAKQASVQDE